MIPSAIVLFCYLTLLFDLVRGYKFGDLANQSRFLRTFFKEHFGESGKTDLYPYVV